MLTGSLVLLRAPAPADQPFLYRVRNDLEAGLLLMSLPRANTTAKVEQWIKAMLDDPSSVFFVIADRKSSGAVGFLQVRNMNFIHGSGELGIYLDESVRGLGHASEALQLIEAYLPDVFNLRKLTLMVLTTNERATTFYLKSGWTHVGVLRAHVFQKRQYHNVAVMEKFLKT